MEKEHNFEICRKLSDLVYDEKKLPKELDGWTNICDILEAGEIIKPKKNDKEATLKAVPLHQVGNFACTAYKKANEIIVAYRGTDDVLDFFADVNFINKKLPFSKKSAIDAYLKIKKENPDCKMIWLTGHSLGGGYAQIVSGLTIKDGDKTCRAISFNAPGVGYMLTQEEKAKIQKELSSRVNNYVVMNDFVGNFRAHLGSTYCFQPYPLNVTNPRNLKAKITPHGCIKEVPIEQLGQHFNCLQGWNSKLAWALYVFDVNKVAPKEQFIRSALDGRVSAKDLKKAITIIRQKQESKEMKNRLTLLNSFKFEAGFLNGFKPELIASND